MKRFALILLLVAGCGHTPPESPIVVRGKVVDCPPWTIGGNGQLHLSVEQDARRYEITVYVTSATCISLQTGHCIQDMQGREIKVTGVVTYDNCGAAKSCRYIKASFIQEP